MISNKISYLEKQYDTAIKEKMFYNAAIIKEQIFNEEKLIFLKALSNFKKSTNDLADSWICCGDILDELTMSNLYPFDQDFQSIELKIMRWIQELETNINNYKGEE